MWVYNIMKFLSKCILYAQEYPPHEDHCPDLKMNYPSLVKKEHRFGLGHPFFAMLPSLLYWTTLWLREHNRVADIMANEHPDWDDERVFQTTKLIILGKICLSVARLWSFDADISWSAKSCDQRCLVWVRVGINASSKRFFVGEGV